jgi:hypothetical protein
MGFHRALSASLATMSALMAISLLWPVAGVQVRDGGRCLLFLVLREGEPLELAWRHSVAGIQVRDVFTRRGGTLYLEGTFTPFFAAGLGEVPGGAGWSPGEITAWRSSTWVNR